MNHFKHSLFVDVASKLAGRPVKIIWRDPATFEEPEAVGLSYRRGEQAVMEVDPTLPPGELLYAVLHEASHAKNDFVTLRDRDKPQKQEVKLSATGKHFRNNFWNNAETRADEEATKWFTWAKNRRPDGGITHWLVDLAACYEPARD